MPIAPITETFFIRNDRLCIRPARIRLRVQAKEWLQGGRHPWPDGTLIDPWVIVWFLKPQPVAELVVPPRVLQFREELLRQQRLLWLRTADWVLLRRSYLN